MNFILTNIPIRSKPSKFPPVGATALLGVLIKEGYNPKFYDIDAIRPSFKEVIDFFCNEHPDILGISAVVSTAYRYTKELGHAVKKVSPHTKIILGGCLGASAEILLRKCPIDVCVVGEGEKVLVNLLRYYERFRDFNPEREEFKEIKGIAFINAKNDFIFTGYEKQLTPEELPQPNYDLLAKFSDINCYIREPLEFFKQDTRTFQPHRQGKKFCYILTSKGCTSRCTFCHRWIKGYRSYPLENIVNTIKYLKEKYNVGFLSIGDETFGANPKLLDEFIEAIGPLDILFRIAGIRILTVYRNPGIVRKLKEIGCVQMKFGMESGSDKILTIMEKGVTAKQNLEVAKILSKEGMQTVHQLVIGMPGENDATIKETIDCIKKITEESSEYPYNLLSINYFQALPGTPGYEYMRSRGLIGNTIDDEERYLLKISDINAGAREHYINVSEEPLSKVLFLWPYKIRTKSTAHWYKCRKWRSLKSFKKLNVSSQNSPSLRNFVRYAWYFVRTKRFYFFTSSLLGDFFWSVMLFFIRVQMYGIRSTFLFSLGIRGEEDRKPFKINEVKSLRRIVIFPDPSKVSVSEANMLPLRMGC